MFKKKVIWYIFISYANEWKFMYNAVLLIIKLWIGLAQRSTLVDRITKSRSALRRDILKLVEQLPNPVLYKTSTQSLLQ